MKRIWEGLTGAGGRRWLRIASYLLIAAGAILLVIAGVNVGYRQWERGRLQARLTQTAPTLTVAPLPTVMPTETEAEQPTDTPQAAPTPTPVAPTEPAPTEQATAAPTEPAPTEQPTAVPTELPSAVPTATAEPTPEPVFVAAALPVRIAMPDLEIDAAVVELGWKVADVNGVPTTVWDLDVIENGLAGHLTNSGLPGQAANVVVAGHHNIEGQVFKNISLLWSDDDAELQADGVTYRSDLLDGRAIILGDAAGQEFTYIVDSMYKFPDRDVPQSQRLANARFMAPTSDPTLTLITCWPPTNNTHRIVVVAKLAGEDS